MRILRLLLLLALVLVPAGADPVLHEGDFLPGPREAKIVEVSASAPFKAGVVVLTTAYATKESGPAATVREFGEVYGFQPAYFAVRRDEPTRLTFWNLQPDDVHDFMLLDPRDRVLMKVTLPPLARLAFVFTFHEEGLYSFYCTLHQPEMFGQILVVPPRQSE
jgi:plastocyanin